MCNPPAGVHSGTASSLCQHAHQRSGTLRRRKVCVLFFFRAFLLIWNVSGTNRPTSASSSLGLSIFWCQLCKYETANKKDKTANEKTKHYIHVSNIEPFLKVETETGNAQMLLGCLLLVVQDSAALEVHSNLIKFKSRFNIYIFS